MDFNSIIPNHIKKLKLLHFLITELNPHETFINRKNKVQTLAQRIQAVLALSIITISQMRIALLILSKQQ